MTLPFSDKLTLLLEELAAKGRSYSSPASGLLASISAERQPIQLPQSVIELISEHGSIEANPYTQEDLLSIMDVLAKMLLCIKQAPDSVPVDDGELAKLMHDYRAMFIGRTNSQLTAMYTRDAFDGLSSIKAYAMAVTLCDIAADRQLPIPQSWQYIVDNYIKTGE